MSVVGLTVSAALASPGLASATASQRKILHAVAQAGGGNLPITSAWRTGASEGTHAQGRAVDFGTAGNARLLPVLHTVAAHLKSQGWRGGIGLGHPPADRHLHVDDRGSPAYFVELSKTRPVLTARLTDAWLEALRPIYNLPPAARAAGAVVVAAVVMALAVWYFRRKSQAEES